MSDTKFIGVPEASEYTNIPPETLKRYLLNHESFLNFKKEGRRYKIAVESLEILKKIREWYSEGLMKEDVNERLSEEGVPITITVHESEEKRLVSVNEELEEMKNMLKTQMQFNQYLLKEVQELKQIVNRREAAMIQELRNSMQKAKEETLKALEEVAASKKGSWFSRWFKR